MKVVIFFVGINFLFSEDFSELRSYIDKVERGDIEIPYEAIYSYNKIVPNHPIYLYLRGLIEVDGDKSVEFYKKLYSIDPNHEYADEAALKIGEYYYSRGLYIQSSDWLKKMPVYYPRSDHCEKAVDLFLKSLVISGKKDTAMFYLKIIKNQIPNIEIHEDYLDMLEQAKVAEIPEDIPNNLGNSFYLQIGVYKEYNNARRVRDVLNLKGFNARIEHSKSNNKRRYIVLEGIYPSSKLAKLASSDIKKELGYQSIVKKR